MSEVGPWLIPLLAGLASFVGTLAANRTDIAWLKKTVTQLSDRLDRHIESHR